MHDEPLILFDFPRDPCLVDHGQLVEQDMPVVPLTTTVLFPYMLTPLFINRERSLRAVEACTERDQTILVVTQRDPDADNIGLYDLYPIGVEANIQRVLKMPDGTTSVVVQGMRRMRILKIAQERPYLQALAVPVHAEEEQSLTVEAMRRAVLSLFEKVVRLSRVLPDDSYMTALNVPEPGWLADMIASTLPLDVPRRQEILETIDPEERLRRLSMILSQELDVLELETRIHNQVQKEVDRSQREFFLREQLKVIQRELGQMDPVQREIILLRERIMSSDMPAASASFFSVSNSKSFNAS